MKVVNTCYDIEVDFINDKELAKKLVLMVAETDEDEDAYFLLDIIEGLDGVVDIDIDDFDFTESQVLVLFDKDKTSVDEIVKQVQYIKDECDLYCHFD